MSDGLWADLEPQLLSRLDAEDDPDLWKAVVADVYRDAAYLCQYNPKAQRVDTVLGRCSHWLRPHQTRWAADGGFAWPSGYNGPSGSRMGQPEYDWAVRFFFEEDTQCWQLTEPLSQNPKADLLTFRVTLPSRTTRHEQAAIHTVWMMGTPPYPKNAFVQFYGYRKINGVWALRATTDDRQPYETVAEHVNP